MNLSYYDYFVLAFYFVFLASIGWITRRFVTNTSDYFRGSGQMLWWMTGASAFMTQFSAWTFTGAAGKAYVDGPIILTVFFANALGFFINYAYFAPKLRQLRVITPIQAVRQRYGKKNEQFFTWVFMPTNILYAGIWLNALGIFLSAVFGFPLIPTIIVTGMIVLFNSTLGGSWAVVSSDFMQTLILMMISIVACVFALIAVGGPVELIERFPADSVLGREVNYPLLIIAWMVFIFIKQFGSTNNIMEASRYLNAKDSNNARKAALMAAGLFIVGPVIWFIPPMASAVLYPDMGALFPELAARGSANEAAFVAIALDTLPMGMVGLLVAGMFAATISSTDSGLNRNAGIFVKNFYLPILRPQASEKEQMLASKLATMVLGCLVISAAIFFSTLKTLPLFDIMVQFGSLVALPITVPLILMMLVRKTPDWAGWSTVLVGLSLSFLAKFYFNGAWIAERFELSFSIREVNDVDAMLGIGISAFILPVYFLATKLFYKEPSARRKIEMEEYWENMSTPVVAEESEVNFDERQGRMLGTMAALYGGFVIILCLIPNSWGGRLSFILAGGALMGVGYLLYISYVKEARKKGPPTKPAGGQPPAHTRP